MPGIPDNTSSIDKMQVPIIQLKVISDVWKYFTIFFGD